MRENTFDRRMEQAAGRRGIAWGHSRRVLRRGRR